MDNLIEILAPLFLEWQQIVIANVGNSLFLAVLAFFVGVLISSFLAKDVTSSLKRQLIDEKKTTEQAETKCAELVKIQLHDAEQMTELQQNHEQIKNKLQAVETQCSDLTSKEQQLSKHLLVKQNERDDLDLALGEKTQLLQKLQTEFDGQKIKLSAFVLDKLKIDEIKRNAEKNDLEADKVKQQLQQLEEQLKEKNQQIEKIGGSNQTSKINKDKISALEAHISQLKSDNNKKSEQDKNVSKTDYAKELENTVKQHDQQLVQFNKKLQLLITSSNPDAQIAELIADNKEDDGFVGKVLGLFASLDKATIGETQNDESDKPSTNDEDIWKKHHDIIEQLTHQLIAEENNKEALVAADKQHIVRDSVSEIVEETTENNIDLEIEKAEDMDSFQHKLKGIYNKIIS